MATQRSGEARREMRVRGSLELVRIDAATELELDPVLQFMRMLWALVHTLQTTSKRMRRELGVTGPQRLVMRVVGLSPGISAGALAKVLHVHPSTLTGVLQRLETQRLVARTSDPRDARRSILRLTAIGQRVNLAQAGTVEAAVRRALSRQPAGDLHVVRTVVSSLIEQFDRVAGHRATRRRRKTA